MNVTIAKSAGFCWGVRRAVETARQTVAAATDGIVHTDGQLIHNTHMVERLAESGVRHCQDPATLPAGSTLLIRAHGISPERREMLDRLPVTLVDATCPDVARIQQVVSKHAANGKTVVILGDHGHAEVVGLLGFAGPRGRVVTSPQDVDALPDDLGDVCFVSQTTQSEKLFEATSSAIIRRYPNAIIFNTICNATRNRQAEVEKLAQQCQMFVVVGSAASANTQRLAQIAASLRPTVVVDSAAELRAEDFEGVTEVALTAGASTPDFIIEAVAARLASF